MHTLGSTFVPPGFHAGGLRYHGMAPLVSHLHQLGLIEARAYHQTAVFDAGVRFARAEGILPAPEANHAVKAAIDEALRCKEEGVTETILFNLSGHGHFDMGAYIDHFAGKLEDLEYDEEELATALAGAAGGRRVAQVSRPVARQPAAGREGPEARHRVMGRTRGDDDRAVVRPCKCADEQLDRRRERERLVGLRAAERNEVLRTRVTEEDVAVRHRAHGDVRHERASVRRGNGDRDRVRPRERRTALGMRQAPRRRRCDDRDEACVGEAPSPRAEHARRKARLRHRRGALARVGRRRCRRRRQRA